MISINATLVLQVIHFLILVFILNRLMLQPILRLINERSEFIAKTKDEIEDLELKTQGLREEYLLRETQARINATQERSQLRSTGMTQAEEFLNASRKEVASIRSDADKEAEKEIKNAQPSLPGEASVLADEIIEKVIGRRILV